LGLVSGLVFWNRGNGIRYKIEKATRRGHPGSITATGTVNAVTTVLVGTQVSGTLKAILRPISILS